MTVHSKSVEVATKLALDAYDWALRCTIVSITSGQECLFSIFPRNSLAEVGNYRRNFLQKWGAWK
jgi:hypothetical protein